MQLHAVCILVVTLVHITKSDTYYAMSIFHLWEALLQLHVYFRRYPKVVLKAHTVEPSMMDFPTYRPPLYNGQTTCPQLILP